MVLGVVHVVILLEYDTLPSLGRGSYSVGDPEGVVVESQVPYLYWQSGSLQKSVLEPQKPWCLFSNCLRYS